jgi:DNA-binding NarL/FixJ family response regulator
VKIAIVEDHRMFREVLRKVCAEELGYAVVGEADDGGRAVSLVTQTRPDIVLMDLSLPTLDGFGVVEAIRAEHPAVRVLVLSSHCDEFTVFRAERARVQWFVDKNTNSVAAVRAALEAVAAGRVWYSESFLAAKAARHRDPQSFDKLLSTREQAVLALIGVPLEDREIARQLGIAAETVEKHRFNILRKLGLGGAKELVRYAREHGFTPLARSGGAAGLLP